MSSSSDVIKSTAIVRRLNEFVVLTDNRLVDPTRRIAIQATRFDLDTATQNFNVEYDPELDESHLWQKMPDAEVQRLIDFNMKRAPNDLIPFRSKGIRRILSISVDEKSEGSSAVVIFNKDESDLIEMRRLIAEASIPLVSDDSDILIGNLVKAICQWYGLKEYTPRSGKETKRIPFLLHASFARCLPSLFANTVSFSYPSNVVLCAMKVA